jgi:hypothetical protein
MPEQAAKRDNLQPMHRDMYETTIPFGEPELARASDIVRYVDGLPTQFSSLGELVDARISTLSGSLLDDLRRYAHDGGAFEAAEALAACVRHGQDITLHLQCGAHAVPLTVFVYDHLVHCPIDMPEFVERHLPTLQVLHVEPAVLKPPGHADGPCGPLNEHHALSALLWNVAMRGARRELLPEIAGTALYRVAPSLDVDSLPAAGALMAGIRRLQGERHALREIAEFPGFDRERAERLLNALYLQAGLIVSRAHPGARR